MGFDIYVQLSCPKCGQVRDNPKASEPPGFRNLVNAVGIGEPCERCAGAPSPLPGVGLRAIRAAALLLHEDAKRWLTETDDRANLRAAECRVGKLAAALDAEVGPSTLPVDWPSVGAIVERVKPGAYFGAQGTVVRRQDSPRLPWVVRWPDGCETGYAAHEIRPAAAAAEPLSSADLDNLKLIRRAVNRTAYHGGLGLHESGKMLATLDRVLAAYGVRLDDEPPLDEVKAAQSIPERPTWPR